MNLNEFMSTRLTELCPELLDAELSFGTGKVSKDNSENSATKSFTIAFKISPELTVKQALDSAVRPNWIKWQNKARAGFDKLNPGKVLLVIEPIAEQTDLSKEVMKTLKAKADLLKSLKAIGKLDNETFQAIIKDFSLVEANYIKRLINN